MLTSAQTDYRESLYTALMELSQSTWENRARRPVIDGWLENFTGLCTDIDLEQLHALHLLSAFTYFGDIEVRELLRALFRDLYRYNHIERIRRDLGDTKDVSSILKQFSQELFSTRFIGVGNPSESGTHLLYYFRQENALHKDHFINAHEIFAGLANASSLTLRDTTIKHYVFIDDFCGSGTQAIQYSKDIVSSLKVAAANAGIEITVAYYVVAATTHGIDVVSNHTEFDFVDTVIQLDATYKAFDNSSRYFSDRWPQVNKDTAREIAELYGSHLLPYEPLGFKDGQLLIGFHHNVPDNCLPIIWFADPSSGWKPVFRRYPKVGA